MHAWHCIAGTRAVYDDGSWQAWSPERAALLEESCWVRVSTAERRLKCVC
jgi:hypothetical protein